MLNDIGFGGNKPKCNATSIGYYTYIIKVEYLNYRSLCR